MMLAPAVTLTAKAAPSPQGPAQKRHLMDQKGDLAAQGQHKRVTIAQKAAVRRPQPGPDPPL